MAAVAVFFYFDIPFVIEAMTKQVRKLRTIKSKNYVTQLLTIFDSLHEDDNAKIENCENNKIIDNILTTKSAN